MTEEIKTLTIAEVSKIARCHADTVRRAIKRGDLVAFRRKGAQGKVLILEKDALEWALGGMSDPAANRKIGDNQ